MQVKSYVLCLPKSVKNDNIEFYKPDDIDVFSKRLGALRSQKVKVCPKVVIVDPTTKTGTRWLDYSEYKKLKKEEG